MSAGWARVNGQWERIAGSSLVLGTGVNEAASGDHTHDFVYSRHAQYSMTGGGNIAYTTGGLLSWSQKFVVNAGRGPTRATAGLFDITMPTSGAVNVINGAARNWSASGVLLNAWESLWYALPIGQGQASVPGNFYIAYYGPGNFNVPENWMLIAARNGDAGSLQLRLGNGVSLAAGTGTVSSWAPDTGWIAPTLLNGWNNYGAPWETAAYRRKDGMVYLRGLIKDGTSVIFNLPAGFRPISNTHSPTMGHASNFAILNIYSTGNVNVNTNLGGASGPGVYVSLQPPPFPADL